MGLLERGPGGSFPGLSTLMPDASWPGKLFAYIQSRPSPGPEMGYDVPGGLQAFPESNLAGPAGIGRQVTLWTTPEKNLPVL